MADTSMPTFAEQIRAYRTRLQDEPRPAAVIDSATAEVIAANAGGLKILGLPGASPMPAALDRSMPALATLREVAQTNAQQPAQRALILRQREHIQLRKCSITAADASQPSHVFVVFPPDDHEGTTSTLDDTCRNGIGDGAAIGDHASLSPAQIAKLVHELKTPLAAIAAASEIMRDQRLGPMNNERYSSYAADIHMSATHALSVISEMLSIGSGGEVPSAAGHDSDLSHIAETIVSALAPLADAKALRLTCHVRNDLPTVSVSATALRQILINLLTNAIKFTPNGGAVNVATGLLKDGGQFLEVSDTGRGMDTDTLAPALVDGDSGDQQRPDGGNGIGLRLVRGLAAENNATVEIDSTPGQGTNVRVHFAGNERRHRS
jgi:two-component system cell cycle sensor histidine kinase PleC